MMVNIVAGAIIVILVAAAVTYIVRAKKKGVKCIGCPDSGCCSKTHHQDEETGCGCGCHGCR